MKNLLAVALVFIVVLGLVVFGLIKRPASPVSGPQGQIKKQALFKDLSPGKSKENDVVKTLGQPIRKEQGGTSSTLVFPSGLGKQPVNITLDQSKTIRLIVEPVAPGAQFSFASAQLGPADMALYGDFARLGFALYVYLPAGTALLANQETGEVKERWYFAPTTFEKFKAELAPGYQVQPVLEGE